MYLFIGIILGYMLGIICERFLFPMGEMLLEKYAYKRRLENSKLVRITENINNSKNIEAHKTAKILAQYEKDVLKIQQSIEASETNAIGFKLDNIVEDYDELEEDDDCDEGYDCGMKKQIGFNK